MGSSYLILDIQKCDGLTTADIIQIIGIVVNALAAIYIVNAIQSNLNNKRVLKDYFIAELKEIKNEYKTFLDNVTSDKVEPRNVTTWSKMMNLRVHDFMINVNKKYRISLNVLLPYQLEILDIITESDDYKQQYRSVIGVVYSNETKNRIFAFQQSNHSIFTDIIIAINDYK